MRKHKTMPAVRLRKVSSPADKLWPSTEPDASKRQAWMQFTAPTTKFVVTDANLRDRSLVELRVSKRPIAKAYLREVERFLWENKWWWLTPPIIIAIAIVLNVIVEPVEKAKNITSEAGFGGMMAANSAQAGRRWHDTKIILTSKPN
jgi:hypothetical protein